MHPTDTAPVITDPHHAEGTLAHELTHWQLMHSAFGVFLRALGFLYRSRRLSRQRRADFRTLYERAKLSASKVHEGTATFAELNQMLSLRWYFDVAGAPYHLNAGNWQKYLNTIPDEYRQAATRVEEAVRHAEPPLVAGLIAETLAWCALSCDILVEFRDVDHLKVETLDRYLDEGSPDLRHHTLLEWVTSQPEHVIRMNRVTLQFLEAMNLPSPNVQPGPITGFRSSLPRDPILSYLALPVPQMQVVYGAAVAILRNHISEHGPGHIRLEPGGQLDTQAQALVETWNRKLTTWWRGRPLHAFTPVPKRSTGVDFDPNEFTQFSLVGTKRPAFEGPFEHVDGKGLRTAVQRAAEVQSELLVTYYRGRESDGGMAPAAHPLRRGQRVVYVQSWHPMSREQLGLSSFIRASALPTWWELQRFRRCLRHHQSPWQRMSQAFATWDPLGFDPSTTQRSFEVTTVRYLELSDLDKSRFRPEDSRDADLRVYILEPSSLTAMARWTRLMLQQSGLYHFELKQEEFSEGVVVFLKPVNASDYCCGFLSSSTSQHLLARLETYARPWDEFEPTLKALWLPPRSIVQEGPGAFVSPRHLDCLTKIVRLFFGL